MDSLRKSVAILPTIINCFKLRRCVKVETDIGESTRTIHKEFHIVDLYFIFADCGDYVYLSCWAVDIQTSRCIVKYAKLWRYFFSRVFIRELNEHREEVPTCNGEKWLIVSSWPNRGVGFTWTFVVMLAIEMRKLYESNSDRSSSRIVIKFQTLENN